MENFVKYHCEHCNGGIEFDLSQLEAGESRLINCPHYPDRKYTAMSIGKETGGITLSEKQNYIGDMDDVEFVRISVKDTQLPINLWVKDTTGVRHYAKGAKKGLQLFYQSKAKQERIQ
jgi:hypothetical protein